MSVEQEQGSKTFWRGFWGVILILILLTLYGVYQKYSQESIIKEKKIESELRSLLLKKISPLVENFTHEQKELILQKMKREIERGVDEIFKDSEKNIHNYLDYHYSVIGEYSELAMALGDKSSGSALLENTTAKKLFGEGFDQRVNLLESRLSKEFNTELLALADNFSKELSSDIELSDGKEKEIYEMLVDLFRVQIDESAQRVLGSVSIGAKAGAGALGAVVVSKLVAKKAAQKAAIKGSSKLSAKFLASTTAASSGVACGPFALICGVAVGTAVWIGSDIVFLEADERLNREERFDEIKSVIDETKESLKEELLSNYAQILNTLESDVIISKDKRVKELMGGG